VTTFAPLLDLLADVPDPRRGQGQKYKLPHVLLFSILAIVTGCNSYRGIVTFIDVHRRRLNAVFGLKWGRAPAHTAIRYILKGLDPAEIEVVFRQHATQLQAARATPGQGSIALDGKTLRGSFDNFNDRAAAQILSAFATDTCLVLAHVDIAEKSNEIPAAQALLAELGVRDGAIVTLDAIHCQKNIRDRQRSRHRPDRPAQEQPADPAPESRGNLRRRGAAQLSPQP
jgi:DDE_Tnp_1-associated